MRTSHCTQPETQAYLGAQSQSDGPACHPSSSRAWPVSQQAANYVGLLEDTWGSALADSTCEAATDSTHSWILCTLEV